MQLNSKKHIFYNILLVLFFVLVSSFFGQDSNLQEPLSEESQIFLEEYPELLEEQETVDLDIQNSSFVGPLLKVIFTLALLVIGIYAIFYFIKKKDAQNVLVDPYIKNPSQYYFSPNKSVQIIVVGDRAFLLGVTDQSIQLIAEIEDKELIDSLKLEDNKTNSLETSSFLSVFTKMIIPDKKNNPIDTENLAQIDATGIQKQRERFINLKRNKK